MRLKQLLNDDNAVSPVIGVILMVAITVILAAVIATFVLGLGEQVSETSPNASFTFDYENGTTTGDDISGPSANGNEDGLLTITHAGGPNIDATQLSIAGAAYNDTPTWDDQSSPPTDVSAGTSISVLVESDSTVSVTWENEEGTESSTLQRYDVP